MKSEPAGGGAERETMQWELLRGLTLRQKRRVMGHIDALAARIGHKDEMLKACILVIAELKSAVSTYVWECTVCSIRVSTSCDFHINSRPICDQCNAEMQPFVGEPFTDEDLLRIKDKVRMANVGASLSAQTPPIEQLVTFIGGIGDLEDENFTQWELDELRRLAKLALGGAAQEEAPREDDHEKAMMEVLTERDEAQEWADNLAYAVGEYFDIDVGEHSSCSDPRVEAMKILKGEYVTKFDKPAQEEAPSPAQCPTCYSTDRKVRACRWCGGRHKVLREGEICDNDSWHDDGVVAEEEAGAPQQEATEFVPAFENPCVDLRHGHGEVKVPWNNRDDEPQEPK